MRMVAERRYRAADRLRKTNENERANGAGYLAGFVVEILLKSKLVEKHPAIARKRQHEVSESERSVWSLIWRSHNLAEILDWLPELEAALKTFGQLSIRFFRGKRRSTFH